MTCLPQAGSRRAEGNFTPSAKLQYKGADSTGSTCLTCRFLISFKSSEASVLAIVSKEFIKYVNGVRESGFALILGPASSTALNRNYFSIYHVLKRMFFL